MSIKQRMQLGHIAQLGGVRIEVSEERDFRGGLNMPMGDSIWLYRPLGIRQWFRDLFAKAKRGI